VCPGHVHHGRSWPRCAFPGRVGWPAELQGGNQPQDGIHQHGRRAGALIRIPGLPRAAYGQIQTLLDDSTSCQADADCQVIHADVAISSAGICDVYVNRAVSFASVEALRNSWNQGCAHGARLFMHCWSSSSANLPVRDGAKALCPDAILPSCPATCASIGHPVNQLAFLLPSVPASAPMGSCALAPAPGSTLICAPQALVPGCGIACTSTYPVTASIASLDAAPDDAVVDAGAAKSEDGDAATFDGSD
jgi:hypothetical protein